jgi:hypothetical protein
MNSNTFEFEYFRIGRDELSAGSELDFEVKGSVFINSSVIGQMSMTYEFSSRNKLNILLKLIYFPFVDMFRGLILTAGNITSSWELLKCLPKEKHVNQLLLILYQIQPNSTSTFLFGR